MQIRNYNEKQIAALALTGLVTNVGLLRDLPGAIATEYSEALLTMIEDNITRLAASITLSEEGATGSLMVNHAKRMIDHCSSNNVEQYNSHGMALQALEDLKKHFSKEEYLVERDERKK